jgi:hypothetical protein
MTTLKSRKSSERLQTTEELTEFIQRALIKRTFTGNECELFIKGVLVSLMGLDIISDFAVFSRTNFTHTAYLHIAVSFGKGEWGQILDIPVQ